jgi:hypothetical protein
MSLEEWRAFHCRADAKKYNFMNMKTHAAKYSKIYHSKNIDVHISNKTNVKL